jgi:uncharacterized membrane protein
MLTYRNLFDFIREDFMTTKLFSKKEALSYGWNSMKENFGPLIALTIGIVIVTAIVNAIGGDGFSPIMAILRLIVNSLIGIVMIQVAFAIFDGTGKPFQNIGLNFKLVLNYLGLTILFFIITFIGLLLFIVPGIYLSVKYCFSFYLLVDKNLGPIEALKQSGEITNGAKLDIFLIMLLYALVIIAGIAALFVGVFVAIPVILMANIYVYRKLVPTQPVLATEGAPVSPESAEKESDETI